jgi:hypothetical protein
MVDERENLESWRAQRAKSAAVAQPIEHPADDESRTVRQYPSPVIRRPAAMPSGNRR